MVSLYYLCREKLRDGQWHDGLLWVWLWWGLDRHDERMRREAINPDFDGWVLKMMVPDFPKAIKASPLKRACGVQCYKRSGLVQDGTPSVRWVGSKCKICLLHERLWCCVWLLTTQRWAKGLQRIPRCYPGVLLQGVQRLQCERNEGNWEVYWAEWGQSVSLESPKGIRAAKFSLLSYFLCTEPVQT